MSCDSDNSCDKEQKPELKAGKKKHVVKFQESSCCESEKDSSCDDITDSLRTDSDISDNSDLNFTQNERKVSTNDHFAKKLTYKLAVFNALNSQTKDMI